MKKKGVFLLGAAILICIAVISGISIYKARNKSVEVTLPETNTEEGNGIAYVDEKLDAFFILDGADWQYEETGIINQVRFFDSDHHCAVLVQSIEDGSVFLKSKRVKIWEKVKKSAELAEYTEDDIDIGQYEGAVYKFVFKEGTDDAVKITLAIWPTQSRVYTATFSQIDENYSEAETALKSLAETFLTYEEYLKASQISSK